MSDVKIGKVGSTVFSTAIFHAKMFKKFEKCGIHFRSPPFQNLRRILKNTAPSGVDTFRLFLLILYARRLESDGCILKRASK